MTARTILVTGATGHQGGAVARRLLAEGWAVRALTRDPISAQALADLGARIVVGDQSSRTALAAAMRGADAVFSVQPGALAPIPVPFDDEIAWGRAVADAAADADVGHLVYASVASAEDSAGVAAFEPKLRIEQHIQRLGGPATVVRPTSFMENYADPAFGLGTGVSATPLAPDIPVQHIAVDDIAAVVSHVLDHPAAYRGRALPLAGDALTPPAATRAIGSALGREIPHVTVPIDAVRAQHEILADVADFLNRRGGYRVDIARCRATFPALATFDHWLAEGGATAIGSLFTEPARVDLRSDTARSVE
ncbi:NmrA/HSCARG family protein [Nocardia bovistercoris]|uniref:NmrA/HSCARG family protein n=1 Tax=Nocardia bovistercoris TaxID=2785916 RepID=A0A931IAK9_9NOCA|nr:NmrA/HSCARG family protein [Nocardia bovistercoris]MBH0777819.1 NmrA/HSCARG family protein [Nocardia bovistercoris]